MIDVVRWTLPMLQGMGGVRKIAHEAPGKVHRQGPTVVESMNMFPIEKTATAWFMLHRIRKAWASESDGSFDGPVEVDEAYFGGDKRARRRRSAARFLSADLPASTTCGPHHPSSRCATPSPASSSGTSSTATWSRTTGCRRVRVIAAVSGETAPSPASRVSRPQDRERDQASVS